MWLLHIRHTQKNSVKPSHCGSPKWIPARTRLPSTSRTRWIWRACPRTLSTYRKDSTAAPPSSTTCPGRVASATRANARRNWRPAVVGLNAFFGTGVGRISLSVAIIIILWLGFLNAFRWHLVKGKSNFVCFFLTNNHSLLPVSRRWNYWSCFLELHIIIIRRTYFTIFRNFSWLCTLLALRDNGYISR